MAALHELLTLRLIRKGRYRLRICYPSAVSGATLLHSQERLSGKNIWGITEVTAYTEEEERSVNMMDSSRAKIQKGMGKGTQKPSAKRVAGSQVKSTAAGSRARTEAFLEDHERVFLWAFCALALLRIFFFSSAFPFFNNVDEQAHFDTVVKYSEGYLPREEASKYEYESAELIVLYGSPEYFHTSGDFGPSGTRPPLWRFDRNQISHYVNKGIDAWTKTTNHEAFSPPVYYALAGVWYDLGKLFGLTGGDQLYWIRFLNILIYGALFWFTYLLCRNTFKNDLSMQFGVLLLLSFFPQDVFYSINSDVLSPLFCLLSLYLLILIGDSDRSLPFYLLTGIVLSATFLVKLSNCPILIVSAILIYLRTRKLVGERRLKKQLPNLLLLASGCLLPIIFWLGWNSYALGDITGSAAKARDLGWTVKPLGEMWDHPIFTPGGLAYFATNLLETFWRGEFVWGLQRIASAPMDSFYVISSCIFVPFAIVSSVISKDGHSPAHRFLNYMSVLLLFLSVFFLVLLSIIYDFGRCWYPSREHPYFSSGRLILGALIPFLVLYVDGLRIIVSKIGGRMIVLIVVLLICISIAYSEIHLIYPVLKSNYNWFHIH